MRNSGKSVRDPGHWMSSAFDSTIFVTFRKFSCVRDSPERPLFMAEQEKLDLDRRRIQEARSRGTLPLIGTFVRLSGPGWLQSALTLGGSSLGSSLYLGILAGVSMIWLQPFAMVLGVIMLSAISYVTLSTGERPLQAINDHLSPALGWAWVIATLMANMVWTLPQYSLCYAVCEQNLLPGVFQGDGMLAGATGKWTVSFIILVGCTLVTWSYGSGSRGIVLYETFLKCVVSIIVLCFMGVVVKMAFVGDGISFGAVLSGLVPRFSHLHAPTETWRPLLSAIQADVGQAYWSDRIVSQQRDVMLSAGAAAVGINMTFLMPYMLLARGWDREFRELTIFDLCTGMFFPFVLATGCIVIASANQFHGQLPSGFEVTGESVMAPPRFEGPYQGSLDQRMSALPDTPIEHAERLIAAALVKRDTQDLAGSLQTLFADAGDSGAGFFANIVFGVGVAAMTLSTISMIMLISGLVVCEIAGVPPKGWLFRLGCMISATGCLWPLVWSGKAKAYLTIPAGVVGAMLLPIAYITFLLLMNRKSLMGDAMPRGWSRVIWNVLMSIAAAAATGAGISAVIKKFHEAMTLFG